MADDNDIDKFFQISISDGIAEVTEAYIDSSSDQSDQEAFTPIQENLTKWKGTCLTQTYSICGVEGSSIGSQRNWIKLWKLLYSKPGPIPTKCRIQNCDSSMVHGAHIHLAGSKVQYIVATCASHNHPTTNGPPGTKKGLFLAEGTFVVKLTEGTPHRC